MVDYKVTNNYSDYEDHARSNEDLRDAMDGKLTEPRLTQSQEANASNTSNNESNEGEN